MQHQYHHTPRIDDPVTGRARMHLEALRQQAAQERLVRLARAHARAPQPSGRSLAQQIIDLIRSLLAGAAERVHTKRTTPLAER